MQIYLGTFSIESHAARAQVVVTREIHKKTFRFITDTDVSVYTDDKFANRQQVRRMTDMVRAVMLVLESARYVEELTARLEAEGVPWCPLVENIAEGKTKKNAKSK